MLTFVAFIVALGSLIAVHEYGHYRMAVACGVKVLRFSVGFGKVLVRWKPRRPRPGQDTEFVLCAIPLGGYVRMLDEREGEVAPHERHLAFNQQPLRSRAAIVAAGPLSNLLLAVLLYAAVGWSGFEAPRAILATPVAGSVAERAGLAGGEWVQAGSFEGEPVRPLASFDDLRWLLMQGALDGRDVRLQVTQGADGRSREVSLPLAALGAQEADAALARRIGIMSPLTQPVIGEVSAGGAAQRAGLQKGDRVLAVGGLSIIDGQQLRDWVRAQVAGGQGVASDWRVLREGWESVLRVTPDVLPDRGGAGPAVGRIGAYVGSAPEMVQVQHGPLEGLWQGVERTWDMSALTLRMMGRMVIGEASLKNLSGPLTIADFAGKSASQGFTHYLVFLALISVSLGVLNLLPIPVLDGGHLMYYLWEWVTGRSVSDAWIDRLQRGGVAVLVVLMSVALFNDVTRFLG
jgi:regulator of sigma E protease